MIGVDPAWGLPAVGAARLVIVAAALLVRRRPEWTRRVAFGGSAAASAIGLAAAVATLRGGTATGGVWITHAASGLSLSYSMDALSAWFLIVLAAVAIPIAIYSIGYVRHPPAAARSVFAGIAFNVLLGAVELVLVADDVMAFLFAWELMTLATAALVATEHESLAIRGAAFLYLVMSHVGTGALMVAFFALATAGHSIAFSTLLAGDVVAGPTRDVLFLLFLIGFGIKAGIVPLHIWLPEAHPAAPSNISALMSGVLIKTGIYGIIRFAAFGLGTPSLWWGTLVLVVGGLSAVLGVLYALMQHDLKRLLAYHSVENIGIILLGVGAGMMALSGGHIAVASLGVAAGLYHVLNHAIFKALLFLGAGNLVVATGVRQIEAYGGLLKRMPWTAMYFLIGAIAICGLPPFNGFASEWLAFQALLGGFGALGEPQVQFLFPVAAALLALTGGLACACFVKAFGTAFLALPRSEAAADAHEAPGVMLVPQGLLAAACLALGLFPGAVLSVVGGIVAALPGFVAVPIMSRGPLAMAAAEGALAQVTPAALALALIGGLAASALPFFAARIVRAVRRVPTWGCGGILTPQTEYTATAFSKPLMLIFSAVYRPTRQVEALAKVSYFPYAVRYRSEIEPTFERYLYGPLTEAVLRMADRLKVLQAGSLHAYLGYVIALVLSLVLFVWWSS